jgi:hypothetical protein
MLAQALSRQNSKLAVNLSPAIFSTNLYRTQEYYGFRGVATQSYSIAPALASSRHNQHQHRVPTPLATRPRAAPASPSPVSAARIHRRAAAAESAGWTGVPRRRLRGSGTTGNTGSGRRAAGRGARGRTVSTCAPCAAERPFMGSRPINGRLSRASWRDTTEHGGPTGASGVRRRALGQTCARHDEFTRGAPRVE